MIAVEKQPTSHVEHNKLIGKIRGDDRTETILSQLGAQKTSVIEVNGMAGSFNAFLLAAIHSTTAFSHIYIANDKEEAAYFQNTLENIGEGKAYFFPDSFRTPMVYEELNRTQVLQRTETINKINTVDGEHQILVTYPEAIFEKVVDPAILDAQKISIKKGEDLDVDTAIEVLVDYGFERVDFVYEPGQFSIRGGIIDIFTYGNEWPYRVELFDEEIESIRTFNPMNQLSLKNIERVAIIPNINSSFKREDKVPLYDIFPEDTLIWIRDYEILLDKLQICFEKTEEYAQVISGKDDDLLKQIFDDRAFVYPRDVIERLSAFSIILEKPPRQFKVKADLAITYEVIPQPSFNRNFTLLIENLEANERRGIENYIFTDSTKQIERFYSIFEDTGTSVSFIPVLKSIHEGFIEKKLKVACYTDHQIFERFHRYRLRQGFTQDQALSMKMLKELQPGDFVTHIDHGIGKYSGLEKIEINGNKQESVRLIYANNDILYVGINSLHKISRYVGKDGTAPKLSKIGGEAWKNLKRKTKKKIKDIAKELIKLYAQRKAAKGHAFPPDGYLQNELEASFLYEDTPDQLQATIDMKADMMQEHPMDRLICGDVGFGKTEVAIRGAFKAIVDGKQVAVLVPTTILALQHAHTFKERLKEFGVEVDYINRFRTTKEKKEITEKLAEGKIDVLIGTHAILNKNIKFKDLGLLIVDEEQKFGVAAKEKLRKMKVNVDTLTLTATPIPRTLQFSLMAARDLSIIRTAPPNRQPIHTERRVFSDEVIRESIYYEVNRGGQVFFVHNRVKNLADIAGMIQRLCPDVKVLTAHGQMDAKQLEKALIAFIDGDYDVLVSTNIIETGLDIPNANTIIINNAHQFGMSDLHQLRGRVGRSNKKAFCYLFTPPLSVLTSDARKRIKTLEEFSELGSGFHIAMRDLDIRGAGNLLGGEQSGFISDIGYETYQKILEEAVIELKETDFKEVFKDEVKKDHEYVRDVEVDTDIEILIPDAYIQNIQERLTLYVELDAIKTEEGLQAFKEKLKDRFGPIPQETERLFTALKLQWISKKLGFEKLSFKNSKLRCYFIKNPQSAFYDTEVFQNILKYAAGSGKMKKCTLKQSHTYLILIFEKVGNLDKALTLLEELWSEVREQ